MLRVEAADAGKQRGGGRMNEDEARRTAWKIRGEVEEMMSAPGVGILSQGRGDRRREKAYFLDGEYNELEDTIVDILKGAASQAQALAGASRRGGEGNG